MLTEQLQPQRALCRAQLGEFCVLCFLTELGIQVKEEWVLVPRVRLWVFLTCSRVFNT